MKKNTKKTLNKNEVSQVIELLDRAYPDAGCELDYDSVYHLLIAVVLSAQTTDVSVNKVTPALFEKFTSIESLASADSNDVEAVIKTIGLYKSKARNIIKLSEKLLNDFNGEVPSTFEELISLPGVGRKTANVVLAEAFGEQRIAVDTHVFRVSNRIGLVCEKDVLSTEQSLMKVIPRKKWSRTHHLLIIHGRRCCNARKPDCTNCPTSSLCLENHDSHLLQ
ncbi:MAG: endonuclease III [Clostridiales bacterium]|jgi:endonuclease-3|nr:endonuclease III [Clostridiales bacterium]